MITNINGNPYTTAQDDLHLIKIKASLRDAVGTQIQWALTAHRGGEVQVDVRSMFGYFELAYALGRAREHSSASPSGTERSRLEEIVRECVDRLATQMQGALCRAHEGRTELDLGPVLELIDQAYYAGREDGAA